LGTPIKRHVIDPEAGCGGPIGNWIWALGDARARTLALLERSPDADLDQELAGAPGSAGSLLFHIAATDMNWLYEDLLERTPDQRDAVFERLVPYPYRGEDGRLSVVRGESLAQHRVRLEETRALVVATLRTLSTEAFLRERQVTDYVVTAQWVAYHLVEHERYHAGQLSLLLASAEQGVL
jgi:uncharacterized damage-inducible protein DinB